MSFAKLKRLACMCAPINHRTHFIVPSMILVVFVSGIALMGVTQVQAADSYLDMLRKEAQGGGADVDKIGNRKALKKDAISIDSVSIKSQSDLEARLERDHPSTFSLYKKLDKKQRQEVYSAYQVNGSFDQVTRKVLKLLYGI